MVFENIRELNKNKKMLMQSFSKFENLKNNISEHSKKIGTVCSFIYVLVIQMLYTLILISFVNLSDSNFTNNPLFLMATFINAALTMLYFVEPDFSSKIKRVMSMFFNADYQFGYNAITKYFQKYNTPTTRMTDAITNKWLDNTFKDNMENRKLFLSIFEDNNNNHISYNDFLVKEIKEHLDLCSKSELVEYKVDFFETIESIKYESGRKKLINSYKNAIQYKKYKVEGLDEIDSFIENNKDKIINSKVISSI